MEFKIRGAHSEDYELVYNFILELAEYEKMSNKVVATKEMIKEEVFDKKRAFVIIAEYDNIPVGFALYFYNFSTFLGKPGIYLEDIYLKPQYRGKGFGTLMLDYLTQFAINNNCCKMEWVCLNWNIPSLDFYKKMGAVAMDDWILHRLTIIN